MAFPGRHSGWSNTARAAAAEARKRNHPYVDTAYHPDGTMQPTVSGLSKSGELQWKNVPKEAWQLKQFPNRYKGDFGLQWMYSVAHSSGALD